MNIPNIKPHKIDASSKQIKYLIDLGCHDGFAKCLSNYQAWNLINQIVQLKSERKWGKENMDDLLIKTKALYIKRLQNA